MIDFNACDLRLLDGIDAVVDTLVNEIGLDPDVVLLVGATCRDIMHSALGHGFVLRGTEDTDIGIALTDWAIYNRIAETFPHTGHTGVRYIVSGLPVDIMPFGTVENPEGIVTPAPRKEELVVFGFEDVYERAGRLALPGGAIIRIPYPPGYTALKLRAWIDRSAYGHDKDGNDIAAAMYWYQESDTVKNRLWETPEGIELLEEVEWDIDRGTARLLGSDTLGQLADRNADDLQRRWSTTDLTRLARALELPAGVVWSRDPKRRLALIGELTRGLAAA